MATTKETNAVPQVYAAISNVTAELAKEGIGKDRKNKDQGYSFRGIDDVYGALCTALPKHNLVILPRAVERWERSAQTKSGTTMWYTTLQVAFDLVCTTDGSMHSVCVFSEGADMSDKSVNKASSQAYKYAVIQTFCIPVEGQEDSDATTPEETIPPAIPASVSVDERKRCAGLYLSRVIHITPSTKEFKDFKEVAGDQWVDVALEAEQQGYTTYEQLMMFANGEIGREEAVDAEEPRR